MIVASAKSRRRLEPRTGCSVAIATAFREIVDSISADHFVESDGPLVERYAAGIVLARLAEKNLALHGYVIGSNRSGQPQQNPWCSVLAQADKVIATLATRLRLAPQSRMDPKTVGRAARKRITVAPPWAK